MNFLSEMNDRKESEEGRMLIQNKRVLVPKIAVIRKEEGATAAASHLPSPWRNSAGCLIRPDRQRFPWKNPNHRESLINYLKCPTNETPAIFSLLFGPPKQMKQQMKLIRCR